MSSHELIFVALLVLILIVVRWGLNPQAGAGESPREQLLLWLAQGFGLGRIPWAPGTFGSLLGLLWFVLLLAAGKLWVLAAGTLAGLGFSVCLSDAAERTLGQKDPTTVIVDEITAMPVCFLSWVVIFACRSGGLPDVQYFFSRANWPLTLGVFATFRFFDVVKPWPVRQSQSLPGGWGVTIDDFLAAVYVNVLVVAVYAAGTMGGVF